eukprot:COSAG06_NODE_31277_length_524_cov_0.745882_1_plen_24_part_10
MSSICVNAPSAGSKLLPAEFAAGG